MRESLQETVKIYVSKHRSRKVFRKFVQVMGCIVAFVTTYALILPAITMENTTFCGLEEHVHAEACYQQQIEHRELICSIGSGLHVHSGECYHENGSVVCGVADYIIHSHDDSCRDSAGVLVCTLPVRSQHVHSSNCYYTPEPVPHVHSDACMADVKGDLTCTQQVSEGHRHLDSCYRVGSELQCTKVEGHQHGDRCYVSPLICTVSTAPHAHGDSCYTTGARICNIPENHIHQGDCIQTNLVCGQTESDHTHESGCYSSMQVCTEDHEHTDGCWQSTLSCGASDHRHTNACYESKTVCTQQEGHTHSGSCYERILNCGKAEGEVHDHVEACYGSPQLNCTLETNHTHIDSCYQQELNCQIPESDGHAHSDACYQWNREYVCGLEAGQPEEQKPELVCKEPEASSHSHGADCFETRLVAAEPVCSENHTHTYSCYQQTCIVKEHKHSAQCNSDPEADVETRQFWESTMKHVELTDDWNANVVAIAESQLGYTESTRNYTVWEDGSRHGYTRYGDWYTVPHGDWCGMFASFCLEYAGVEGMPYNYGVRPWIEQLSELDLYRTTEEYTPIPGDLVFFDWEKDKLSDHVGIVYEVIEATETEKAKLKTIEGNSSNCVQFRTYDLDNPVLLGYSMLPENPDVEYICNLDRHIHSKQNCYDAEGNPICQMIWHQHEASCIKESIEETPPEIPADPVYYCGLEIHEHDEACYDADGNPICQLPEHQHEDSCLVEPPADPVYYCGLEIHEHDEACYDADGNSICQLPEHQHEDSCLVEPSEEPEYYCGLEEHLHDSESCYDENGDLACQQTIHEHGDDCLIEPTPEPVYYCGLEAHTHAEDCYDADGNEICEKTVHEHGDDCLIEPTPEPVYYCGLEVHAHAEDCYDADGNEICEKTVHEHDDDCLIEPTPEPVYYCGLEVHAHSESCLDEAGKLSCSLDEHEHDASCLIRYYCGKTVHVHDEAVCFDADGNLLCEKTVHEHLASCLTEPKLYCTKTEHTHDEVECYDETGNLTCEIPEHTHSEVCWQPLMMAAKPKRYYCGYTEEHSHGEGCYDEAGELTCEKPEHTHTDACSVKPPEYFCGMQEHTHEDACRDSAGGLICSLQEHTHKALCQADLSDLSAEDRAKVEEIILMIEAIPSADDIDAKLAEFEEAEDYEGEETWLTEVYQKISLTYANYMLLDDALRLRVVNRDKLLEMEYIWSMMPLPNTCQVWLDGTNGNMTSLKGSDNTLYKQVASGTQVTLPTSWKSPAKYSYTLQGWYAINRSNNQNNGKGWNEAVREVENNYYEPGATVTITEDTVFYADWIAATYDIGQFNANVVDTISTNNFITTKLFDYTSMFNMYSSSYTGSVSKDSHSERWSIVDDNTAIPGGSDSFGLTLRDWDEQNPVLSYPSNISDWTHYSYSQTLTQGLLNMSPSPLNLFFDQSGETMGVNYIGTADHLFQYDPDTGYYYYDSAKNAASYKQSAERFYVYDYLERANRTSDEEDGAADFLPFNYPTVNTNGKTVPTGTLNGQLYYQYDKLYQNSGSSTNRAGINYWFGMHMDIRFYLPQSPGADSSGNYGNRSINGEEMIFAFSGDDDVWVMVDGKLILDLGGIHKAKSGTINFSTGVATITDYHDDNGALQSYNMDVVNQILDNLEPGEHHLSLYYMERGSSFSNCHIYFNISPRFMLSLKKQDLLSNKELEGVTFGVYTDEECKQPATLWANYESSVNGNSIHTFTTNAKGEGSIWGFSTGNTYYIREESAAEGYSKPTGLIKMVLDYNGTAHYTAMVVPDENITDTDKANPSPGFTANLTVDETAQMLNLNVTNSLQEGESTEVYVRKVWNGPKGDPVTVYLLADNQRIREITLSDDNDWHHIWDNLPKYKTGTVIDPETGEETQGNVEIVYTVEEGTVSGYTGTIEAVEEGELITQEQWLPADELTEGQTYVLSSGGSNLAAENGKLSWSSDMETDKTLWTVLSEDNGYFKLKNGKNQYLRYNSSNRYFYASTAEGSVMFENPNFVFNRSGTKYRMTAEINSTNGRAGVTVSSGSAAAFTLLHKSMQQIPAEKDGFVITNTPIPAGQDVSVTVVKSWSGRDGEGEVDASLYQELQVPVRLLSNKIDTGQTATLKLQNGWTYTFTGLPRENASGIIQYTVVEELENEDWHAEYTTSQIGTNSYRVEIDNRYDRKIKIPVEKRWDAAINGSLQDDITVQLYKAIGDQTTGELVSEITLSAESGWKGVIEAIPLEELEGSWNYYLYEPTNLFAPSYSNRTSIFIDGRSQSVSLVTFDPETGEPDPQRIVNFGRKELPQTGGAGTIPYTAGGVLLMLAAWLLLYNKIFKRRRGAV